MAKTLKALNIEYWEVNIGENFVQRLICWSYITFHLHFISICIRYKHL